jgi:3-oxoacyl-[acyl-carrier protein] reductase
MRLRGKIALITGGGSGIGAIVAHRFALEGATVCVADVDPAGAQKVAEEITDSGKSAVSYLMDVADRVSVHATIDEIVDTYGELDILINNAGIARDNLAARMSEEEWDAVVNINLKGTFLCSQAAYRPMRKQRYGKIVNTASVVVRGNLAQANYIASKAGIIGLTRSLALEFARSNINVNCVAPGFIETPMTSNLPEKTRELALERIALKRMGRPDDVADLHVFLSSDEASYITGQVIFVDGGASLGI